MPDASLPVKLTLMLPNFERIRNSTIFREFVALCEGYAFPTFDKDWQAPGFAVTLQIVFALTFF